MTEFDELMAKAARGAKNWLRDLIREEVAKAGLAAAVVAGPAALGGFCAEASFEPDSVGVITPAQLGIGGFFVAARENPDGSLDGPVAVAKNMVVNAALNDVLSVYLGAGSQKTTWYLGIVDNAAWSAFAAGDTIASHAGWNEMTGYTQATRPTWSPSAPSGQTITNGTSVTFTANATIAVKGCFLVSDNAKSGTAGTLFATGAFSSVQNLVNGQNLKVTYTCPASAT